MRKIKNQHLAEDDQYRIMKLVGKIAGIAISILFAGAIACYVFQVKLIFQADALDQEYHFSFDQSYEEYFIPTPDNQKIMPCGLSHRSKQKDSSFIFMAMPIIFSAGEDMRLTSHSLAMKCS